MILLLPAVVVVVQVVVEVDQVGVVVAAEVAAAEVAVQTVEMLVAASAERACRLLSRFWTVCGRRR